MFLCANGGVMLGFSHHRKPRRLPRDSSLRFTPWYRLGDSLETRVYMSACVHVLALREYACYLHKNLSLLLNHCSQQTKGCLLLFLRNKGVLASAAHILKLEQYRED